jgi:hypothetical protein
MQDFIDDRVISVSLGPPVVISLQNNAQAGFHSLPKCMAMSNAERLIPSLKPMTFLSTKALATLMAACC